MKILLYSLNYSPEKTGIGKYNAEMLEYLNSKGNECFCLCAPPYYPEWNYLINYTYTWYSSELVNGVKVFRSPVFVPKKLTTLKRILHLISFSISSGFRLLSLMRLRPNILFVVQPTFFCTPISLLYCKLTGAKSVLHIQDYELDAMLGLKMGKLNFFRPLMSKLESWIMKRFDYVSTISISMYDKAMQKGVQAENLYLLPNWADLNFVTPQTSGLRKRRDFGFSENDKIILYSGNIGNKQGLEIVLDAAVKFKKDSSIKFVIIGAGANLLNLKNLASKLGLLNVLFFPLVEWGDVPEVLAMANIHLVIQKRGAADAVLPSKLTNILSAGGHAIVTAEQNTELGKICAGHPGIFCLIQPECVESLVNAIRDLLGEDVNNYNQVARAYAEQYLHKEYLIDKFFGAISTKY